MDEQKKREIIQVINEIRKEIGLRPYPPEQLEIKELEELERIYLRCVALKKAYLSSKKEKKFKLNLKVILPVGAVIIGTLFFIIIQKNFIISNESGKISLIDSTECINLTAQIKEVIKNNYCVDNNDCKISPASCLCVNRENFDSIENLIQQSGCKIFEDFDCSNFECVCEESTCGLIFEDFATLPPIMKDFFRKVL